MTSLHHPEISIIVPFYNLEGCVKYCLDSILEQTYNDFEVICVDDGSTDTTKDALDAYAHRDDRIHVFHKQNGGAASARNYGVRKACGEFVSFVDGDDIVSPYYLETLISNLENQQQRMVVGVHTGLLIADVVEGRPLAWKRPEAIKILDRSEMIEAMLYEDVLPSACMRLAQRSIYVENPFPEGEYYEDIATAGHFANQCSSFALIEEPIYAYVMKPGSVVHRKHVTLKQAKDYQNAIASFVDSALPSVEDERALKFFQSLEFTRLYRLLEKVDCSDEEVREIKSMIVRYVRTQKGEVIGNERVGSLNQLRVRLMSISPSLMMKLSDFYDRWIKEVHYK